MRKFDRILGDAVLQPEALRAARALGILRRWELVVGVAMAERSWPDRYDLRFGVRPLRRPFEFAVVEDVVDDSLTGLSIREIAERRMKKWQDDSADHG